MESAVAGTSIRSGILKGWLATTLATGKTKPKKIEDDFLPVFLEPGDVASI